MSKLVDAVAGLNGLRDVSTLLVEIHTLEDEADQLVRKGTANLFSGGMDPLVVIRWKDIHAGPGAGRGQLRARCPRAGERLSEEPMTDGLLWLVIVGVAVAFDFTNGFHDTANAVATSVSTRALPPRLAVLIAATMNVLGAFVYTAVAKTVGSGLVDPARVTEQVLVAALLGAISWNLVTWYMGLPSSSSHALIGGLVGAAVAADGTGVATGAGSGTRSGCRPCRARCSASWSRASVMLGDPVGIPAGSSGAAQPRLPGRPDRVRQPDGLSARHQRRPEDHGCDRPGAALRPTTSPRSTSRGT